MAGIDAPEAGFRVVPLELEVEMFMVVDMDGGMERGASAGREIPAYVRLAVYRFANAMTSCCLIINYMQYMMSPASLFSRDTWGISLPLP